MPVPSRPPAGGSTPSSRPPAAAGQDASPSRGDVARRLPAATRRLLARRELPLTAAGLTFYLALAAVPSVLIALRVLGWTVGEDRVLALGESMRAALPSAMGADVLAERVVAYGLSVSWPVVLFSLLPASLYGEGLRRAYAALGDGAGEATGARPAHGTSAPLPAADDGATRRRGLLARLGPGWRARATLLPVLAVAPLLLLVVLGVTPLLADLFARGVGGTALGVYLALNVVWVVVSLPLSWTFRTSAPQELSWRASLVGGFCTGAFVAGFIQGIVLFVALPVDIGAPFGGSAAVGGVVAALLWCWLLHVVVLVGLAATLTAVGLRRGPRGGTDAGARPV
ncbi:YhjD/YihY/BrkB family envelope integrity protein [Pseudokineococcus lusitanus]|uniref:Membrane protein n=1 Tax=Pseudokineococcus lusitanus TaxID=763993 RepID=A0A3N1HTY7_9ACTN|nr:YhjD/YihY/BrkB family envelope integrity protein [Pseudokineococcus lusitanus]ROP46004.1 membrane protein [Pseudokineococcus lusitanus]